MKKTQGSKDIVRAVNGIQVSGDFTVTRNINGQTVSIYYDKNGFPNFQNYSAGSGYNFSNFSLKGDGNDMRLANLEMRRKFANQPDKFKWDGVTTWFEIRDANGNWVQHTWHHHQDGRTMFPVPSDIHNATEGGFSHSGGKAIITRGLEDLFNF